MNKYIATRVKYADNVALAASIQATSEKAVIDSWPQPIDPLFSLSCCKAYIEATNITPRLACVCCSRAFFVNELATPYNFSFNDVSLPTAHPLSILRAEYSEPTTKKGRKRAAQLKALASVKDPLARQRSARSKSLISRDKNSPLVPTVNTTYTLVSWF
jgi:hypothetical protein